MDRRGTESARPFIFHSCKSQQSVYIRVRFYHIAGQAMQNAEQLSSPWKSRLFVIIFVIILAGIVTAFVWIVQSAKSTLPQADEIISVEDAAQRIGSRAVEKILLQGEQDVFLYLPGQARPLYAQLELGKTFTATLEALGIPTERFPPVTVESD